VSPRYAIALARPRDVAALAAIELAAARLLEGLVPESVLTESTPADELHAAQTAGLLWVALDADAPVGFAHVEILADGLPHLEELDVHPEHGRRGIGTALVRAVCDWVRGAGHPELTLTTFRAVRWNMPFYTGLDFEEVLPRDVRPAVAAVVRHETARGLDPAARVVMRWRPERATARVPTERPPVRTGYDRCGETYDGTPNPLVALDRRYTIDHLRPCSGERILDAGCGTGANLEELRRAGSAPVGLDLSRGMLAVARRRLGTAALAVADLERALPLRSGSFDAVLCALVGEHLVRPATFFAEAHRVLASGGRLVFSVFHPDMAMAGVEAKFERDGVVYRLGAERHGVDDYQAAVEAARFVRVRRHEYRVDRAVVEADPSARKYFHRLLLLVLTASRAA
jgi:SAM-dependent methyltransferase/GNAT superfamily N-acetyltransferase